MGFDNHPENFDWLCAKQASPGALAFFEGRYSADITDVRLNAHFHRLLRHATSNWPIVLLNQSDVL
jgi:hypothetical protein